MAAPLRSAGAAEGAHDLHAHAPCGLVSLSPDGRILAANPTLAAWLGHAGETMAGRSIHDLLMVPAQIFYASHLSALLRVQGWFEGASLDLKAADGRKVPAIAAGVEERDLGGAPLAIRLALLRAPERRRFERALIEARSRAEQDTLESRAAEAALRTRLDREIESAAVQEETVAILGHELRHPLAAILHAAGTLRGQLAGEAAGRLLDVVERSALRLSSLVEAAQQALRGGLGAGIAAMRSEPQPVAPILAQAVAEARAAFPDRDVEAAIGIAEPVRCDPALLGSLASALLGCALAGPGAAPVRFGAATADGMFVLTVARGGPPLPDDAIAALFSPSPRRRGRPGEPALGLAIAAETARAQGGTLTVDTTGGETRFLFRMPID